MTIAMIMGTRPEIIKMSPIIRYCKKMKKDFFVILTGQHYSKNLVDIFFKDLNLPKPNYVLNIKSKSVLQQGDHTARMMIEIENILLKKKPKIVLVYGDTNSCLAGALVTSKIATTWQHVKIGHVEAGLRSKDRSMPEELNRITVDHLSDYLFAPTAEAVANLVKENIDRKIKMTGNTIVDAVMENKKIAKEKSKILKRLHLEKNQYFLVTSHRQESVDIEERLKGIIKGLNLIQRKYNIPVIFAMHPRTKKRIQQFGIRVPKQIRIIYPTGFLDFLQLELNARLILTDSGGVQEEACILKIPCVTLRNNTERPETIEIGSNVVAGYVPDVIAMKVDGMLKKEKNWKNPFGDGKAAKRIVEALK